MKRLITLFIVLFMGTALFAQEGLYVEELFEGKGIAPVAMRRNFISGSQLAPYHLDTYKSIAFQVAYATYLGVEDLVLKDAEAAVSRQIEYAGDHLTSAVICLPPTITGLNRFLCFQAKENKGLWDVTLVYLRGTASVGDLDKMFNKRKQ